MIPQQTRINCEGNGSNYEMQVFHEAEGIPGENDNISGTYSSLASEEIINDHLIKK